MNSCRATAVLGTLVAIALSPALADDGKSPSGTKGRGSGSSYQLGQLRLLFDSWDLNRDGFVDRAELAKAFRGPHARPYTGAAPASRVADRYPDFAFMLQVDRDKDGKISADEFEAWAKGYLQELRKIRSTQRRVAQLEKKLATETNAAEKKQLAAELADQRKYLEMMKKEIHAVDLIEKHLSRRKLK
jgi:Ca2+-binding EF-hand superfamily protein